MVISPNGIYSQKENDLSDTSNITIGNSSFKNYTSAENNIAIGRSAMLNSNASNNIGIGKNSLKNADNIAVSDGNNNVAVGHNTLRNLTYGASNLAIGDHALNDINGYYNTAIGNMSASGYVTGHQNTSIGFMAGSIGTPNPSHQIEGNVFLGFMAGRNVSESNKLYIANSDTDKPLIWGDFLNAKLGFHGKVGVGTKNPNELVNIHDGNSSIPQSYLRFTNSFSGQGISNGFRIGLSEFMMGVVWHFENKPIVFGTNNISRMTIHENGRVGIGTTNPQASLHVYQNAGVSGLLLNNSYNGSGFLDGLFLGSGQSSSSILNRENNILFLGTNNTNIATLHPDGKFGIGLNGLPASSDLHIHKQDFADTELRLTNIPSGSSATDGFTLSMKNSGELEMNYRESQKVVFQTNTSATPELVLHTNGNMGLGVTTASTKLEVNGFTKLGTDAPAIKIKKLIVQTASTDSEPDNIVYVPHGLNGSKILGVQILVEYAPNQYVPHAFTNNPSYEFHFLVNNTNDIELKVKPGNSSSILNKTAKILITYEE